MPVPHWWDTRRYGLFVHSNLATVPAWSPIGQYADWYLSHLGEPVADVLLHPQPMVEVLAHHRDRWGHLESFDDFFPLLTYDRFDPDDWAGLAQLAGMSYTVFVAKHHDGLCWWDAPNTDRTVLHDGPARNVLAEYAAACERADLVFGTYYSLLDWADHRYPSERYVSEVLHPHVRDLVERYGSQALWGDGHWGHGEQHWRSTELIEQMRAIQPDLVVNDRWWIADPDIVTFEYQTPDGILDRPWELCRGIGHSFGHNRAERAEHHLSAAEIVALLTEVVAKGGNLLLNVGPAADGSIPELQRAPLVESGTWIRANRHLVGRTRPWHTWGDVDCRYLVPLDDAVDDGGASDRHVEAVDVTGRGRFAALGQPAGRVRSVVARDGADLTWDQHEGELRVRRRDRTPAGLAAVYRVELDERREAPIELFAPVRQEPIELATIVAGAAAGSIVQLGDGPYIGPVRIPAGVIVRGLGHDRTFIDGHESTAVTLDHGARLEHVTVRGGGERVAWFPIATVRLAGDDALLLGCHVMGHAVVDADRAKIRACVLDGVVSSGRSEVTVSRSRLNGMRWDVGVDITGGFGHVIETCEIRGHLCAIRINDSLDATVRGNVIEARWWGVHLIDTDSAHVVGNSIAHTMRAVDVDGGSLARVDGNAVADGDSGCIIQRGASGAVVSGNHWENCRIGLLAWDAGDVRHDGNALIDLHEHDRGIVIGP
jgi:alpha-L-fucosidase